MTAATMTAAMRRFAGHLALALVAATALTGVAAAPAMAAGPCELDIDTWKANNTVHSYAVQLCDGKPPNPLYFDLETQVCDSFNCSWVAWKHVRGSISMPCPPVVSVWRSSRLRSKTVWC
jgi:hypothetical protein